MSDKVEEALELSNELEPHTVKSPNTKALIVLAAEVRRLREVEAFANACCDKPEDRMWHAEDNTWWRRVKNHRGDHWVAADAPAGFLEAVKQLRDGNQTLARRMDDEGAW